MAKGTVGGVSLPSPSNLESRDSSKLAAFAEQIPDGTGSEAVLFGRAVVVITAGDFEDEATLFEALETYVDDLPDDTPDEHVVKSLGGVHLTIGDLRAFVMEQRGDDAKLHGHDDGVVENAGGAPSANNGKGATVPVASSGDASSTGSPTHKGGGNDGTVIGKDNNGPGVTKGDATSTGSPSTKSETNLGKAAKTSDK